MENTTSSNDLPTIRVAYVDFYEGFDPQNHHVPRALRRHFNVIIDNEKPDVLFYSCFGVNHLRYKDCLRIFYTGENVMPNFNVCDFAISSNRLTLGDRHLYLPQAVLVSYLKDIKPLPELTPDMAHRNFCSFIYSNATMGEGSRLRTQFCKKLSEYAHVDCPGKVLHNMDAPELSNSREDWHSSKIRFLGRYKFNISFENSNTSGYITEKLTDAFLGNTVPIYWGSEGDVSPYPRDAMILANDYDSLDSLLNRVREVNENDELYMSMLAANPLRHGMNLDPQAELEAFLFHSVQRKPFEKDPSLSDVSLRVKQMIANTGVLQLKLLYFFARAGSYLTFGKQKALCNALKAFLHDLKI